MEEQAQVPVNIGHINIVWDTTPIPTSLILNNNLTITEMGICCIAMALALQSPKTRPFAELVKEIGDQTENFIPYEAIRTAIVRGFNLPNTAMLATLQTGQPKIKYSQVRQKTSDRYVEMTAETANNLAVHFPGIDVSVQFTRASNWYGTKGLKLTRDKFIQWCNRIQPISGGTSSAASQGGCIACGGRGYIIDFVAGEAQQVCCDECQNS